MSRLEFGPEPKRMEVTDIATGHFVFQPVAGKSIAYEALDKAIRDAGYEIEAATITVAGTYFNERHLKTPGGQLFHLVTEEESTAARLEGVPTGESLTVTGAWRAQEGSELLVPTRVERAEAVTE